MNHVTAGATVGLASSNPVVAAGAGFMSHFVMDAIPHWGDIDDDRMYRTVAVRDGLVGLGLAGLALMVADREDRPAVAAGIAGACLPDYDKPSQMFFGHTGQPRWFRRAHQRIQKESSQKMRQEWMVAAALAGAFVAGVAVKRQVRTYRAAVAGTRPSKRQRHWLTQ